MREKTKLYVISHTHWDREWYETFEEYRYRLIRSMDELIHQLEQTADFKAYHLDGQTIVLEDYLRTRPENRVRLEKLIQEGRILIGPWYVMPDEFLISGEALVKNLQKGCGICAEYGTEPMKSGYVTDIFGHNSQFPQVLRGFGIESAVLYRGIGDYEKDAFRWESPDGSAVTAAKLDPERSYSNFYFTLRWPYENKEFDLDDAVTRMKALVAYSRSLSASNCILMMDGVDHIDIEPMIPAILRDLGEKMPDVAFIHASLGEYFDALKAENPPLDVIGGALYHVAKSGVNNQVLKNVLSSMVHLKQHNDNCERLLSGGAEPLHAFTQLYPLPLFGRNDYAMGSRRRYLDEAWTYLLQNQPHDSICGCSLPEVHQDNVYRFRQSEKIGGIAIKDCLHIISENVAVCGVEQDGAVLLYNSAQTAVDSVAICTIPVRATAGSNLRFYGPKGEELNVQVLDIGTVIRHDTTIRQLISFEPMRHITAALPLYIPAFGYTVISYKGLPEKYIDQKKKSYSFESFHAPKRLTGSLMTGRATIDNGKLTVTITPQGTLDVLCHKTGKTYRDLLLLEDCADIGDGWNYSKPMLDREYFSPGASYSIENDGDFACVIRLTHRFYLPEAMSGEKRSETEKCQIIHTFVTLLKGSSTLLFRTVLENTVQDHRLRVLFPTALETDCFYTKTPYDMQKWEIAAEAYSTCSETETFVHPSQGVTYITDGTDSLSVYSQGLYEVEITDNPEHALARSLFRAFKNVPGTAQSGDVQLQRKMEFSYAAAFCDESPAAALTHGEAFRAPLHSHYFLPNKKGALLPPCHSFLTVDSKEKLVSAVVSDEKDEKSAVVRLYDVSGNSETVTLTFNRPIADACTVQLDGTKIASLPVQGNSVALECAPHKIVSIQVKLV